MLEEEEGSDDDSSDDTDSIGSCSDYEVNEDIAKQGEKKVTN